MLDTKDMKLRQVKGNTWVLESWLMIPLYRVDEQRCILLDSGLAGQEQALDACLWKNGLRCVGIVGSHAHMDHMGCHAFFQREYGADIAMSLGEAGAMASVIGMESTTHNLSPRQVQARLGCTECVADVIIRPEDTSVKLCGVTFEVFHSPGHSVDHICVKTPDNVAYLGDAIMTGRTLYRAKFPYVMSMQVYFDSLRRLREWPAEHFIVAHMGIYPEIISFVDMELVFFQKRMQEILALIEGELTIEELTARICAAFGVTAKEPADVSYFERCTRSYLHYLMDLDLVEWVLRENRIYLHRTARSMQSKEAQAQLPPPGAVSLQYALSVAKEGLL